MYIQNVYVYMRARARARAHTHTHTHTHIYLNNIISQQNNKRPLLRTFGSGCVGYQAKHASQRTSTYAT